MTKTATKSPQLKSLSDYHPGGRVRRTTAPKDVARYIVDHLDEAAFLTAEELARRASTSSSTVVRFSQALGFEGYPELQQAAIEEYRTTIAAVGSAAGPLFSFDHFRAQGLAQRRLGVLALQGDFEAHCTTLRRLGAEVVEVRTPEALEGLDGPVTPGGESTTMTKLIEPAGLEPALRVHHAAGRPILRHLRRPDRLRRRAPSASST